MPEQYDNEGKISIFKNDKGGNDKRPDYRGKAQVAGKELEVSLWLRTAQSGMKYMSGTIQPARDRQPPIPQEHLPEQPADSPADDVPF